MMTSHRPEFQSVHNSLNSWIAREFIPSAASIIIHDGEIVDEYYTGYQDMENQIPIQPDSIFRIFSNTKLLASIAAMKLYEQGQFNLDDEIAQHIPELADLKVLKEGSTDLNDTESLKQHPTLRQLMSHTVGFSYGIFAESPVDQLYMQSRILDPSRTLEEFIHVLKDLPLANQPGARFRYSVATDVLARLIEIWSGMSFGEYLKQTIFDPLDMKDTAFQLTEEQRPRFCMLYAATDQMDPLKPGLFLSPEIMGDYFAPRALQSGGGGLVGTIKDYENFMRMLANGGEFQGHRVIKYETLEMMLTNQLPKGMYVELMDWDMPGTVFGLGFAMKLKKVGKEYDASRIAEYYWGGLAGTHTWISPEDRITGLVFTQRMPGFWHPFYFEYRRELRGAIASLSE